jgi:hypothetical protein
VWPDWKNTITTKNNDDENPDTYMALDFFRLLQTMEMPSKKPIHQETGRCVLHADIVDESHVCGLAGVISIFALN